MAAIASAATGTRGRPSWAVLYGSVAILLLAVALVLSGLLVKLGNNREGHPILPPTVRAGESVNGTVVLTNQGLLPVEVSLQPKFGDSVLPAELSVTVQDLDTGAFLYQGPMQRTMGPLEVLLPTQGHRVRLTVISTDTHGTAAVPINYTWYWAAKLALPWWWWIPAALLIVLFLAIGYRRAPPGGG